MLKVPQIDDVSYDQLISRAVNRIPAMTKEWTDFNYHDPGITVLSTYAWLLDMLNYYMNATGDVHVRKYLKLLGIRQKKARAAKAYLSAAPEDEGVSLPKGTPVYAGNVCFETEKAYEGTKNRFVSYINEVDGKAMDLTMFAGADNDFANLFAETFQDHASAYFGFSHELAGQTVLQVCVEEQEQRNAFDDTFFMCSLVWEYYGETGWTALDQVEDGTCGFLRNGFIRILFPGPTKPFLYGAGYRKAHYIRCILKANTYDCMPRIGSIYVNPFPAEQKSTLCRMEVIEYQGQDSIEIPFYIPRDSRFMAGIETKEGGRLIYDDKDAMEGEIQLASGGRPYLRKLCFASERARPKAGTKIHVFVVHRSFAADFTQGTTNGCANQEIYFPYPGLYEISITTWKLCKDGHHQYERWQCIDDLNKASDRDRVFTYDFEEQKIRFGDGYHGVVPAQNQHIRITGLTVSRLSLGNVLEGEINRFEEPDFAGIKIRNPQAAFGGRRLETAEDMIKRMEKAVFSQKRMVSPEDYREAVSGTPGLLIDKVEVISGKRYGSIHGQERDENEVVLVVKPCSGRDRPPLNRFYREKIQKYIEDKRLINIKVSIVSPAYAGVGVNGRIRLANKKPDEKEMVYSCIREFITGGPDENGFGRTLVLGRLFTRLETLEAVRMIRDLSLERVGRGAVKNQRGDLLLYEDALAYVRSIQIEFC